MEEEAEKECPKCAEVRRASRGLYDQIDSKDSRIASLQMEIRDLKGKCSDRESYCIIRDLEGEKKRILELVADKYGRKARQEFELALICEFA